MLSVTPWAPYRILTNTATAPSTYDQLYPLVDLYFKHINPWSPILDRSTSVETFFGVYPPAYPDGVLLLAIIAVTLRFSADPYWTPQMCEQMHALAREQVLIQCHETPSLKALQAITILAWNFLGASEGPQISSLVAIAVRNVTRMGLHLEGGVSLAPSTTNPPGWLQDAMLPTCTSWLEDEGRRRLFWVIYALERYEAVSLGSDCALPEEEINRRLPCRYDLFSQNQHVETGYFSDKRPSSPIVTHPENLGSFSYHCEVLRVLGRTQIFFRRPLDICSQAEVDHWRQSYRDLDDELSSSLANLPNEYSKVSQLCHSDPTSRISNWIMFHAAVITTVIRLHSCAAYPTARSLIFMPSLHASQRCLAAVDSLWQIAQDVYQNGVLNLLGPHFGFAVWTAARVQLVHAANTSNEIDSRYKFFIFVLNQMSHVWPVTGQYAQRLENVCERSEKARSAPGGDKSAPKALCAMRK